MSDRFDEDLLDDPTGELRKGLSALEEFEGAEDFETADEFEEAMTNGLKAADTDAFFGGLSRIFQGYRSQSRQCRPLHRAPRQDESAAAALSKFDRQA